MSEDLKAKARAQFGATARAYASSDVHARGESLGLLLQLIQPQIGWRALDVATGAGHTAVAFAPYVASVVATDLTESMLGQTAELAARRDVANVQIACVDAEALPFGEDRFDLITCRLAFHHFPHPQEAIREFARALKPGGILGFTDNIVVADQDAAAYYNAYEKLRDPSHHRVYPLADLQVMFEAVGLHVAASQQLSKEFEFHAWADRQRASNAVKAELLYMMRRVPRTLQPLFRPRWTAGTLYFSLWEAVIVASNQVSAPSCGIL